MVAPIWRFFTKREEGDSKCAYCKICKTRLALCQASTTTLHTHLRAHHKAEYAELVKEETLKLEEQKKLTVMLDEAERDLVEVAEDVTGIVCYNNPILFRYSSIV